MAMGVNDYGTTGTDTSLALRSAYGEVVTVRGMWMITRLPSPVMGQWTVEQPVRAKRATAARYLDMVSTPL